VPNLRDFLKEQGGDAGVREAADTTAEHMPSMPHGNLVAAGRSVFVETYGCQMNVSDTEVVNAILQGAGYSTAESAETADVVLLNTCAIREKAEERIWNRLDRQPLSPVLAPLCPIFTSF